jgi:cytidine deaminase
MRGMRQATSDEIELYDLARTAAEHAHVPYSHFPVGAALRVSGRDEPVLGANVENASFGLTSCAERNAVFTAVGAGLRDFEAIAVHGEGRSVSPCGACRQVLAEFAPQLMVIYRRDGDLVAAGLDELLPERFAL